MTTAEMPAILPVTPAELRSWPVAKRETYLRTAAELAENDYLLDPELTDFEAFGEEDLHGRNADAQPG
jgi:hypothetical protein